MNHVAKSRGFTITELMLAMTFISVLLLAIAMTIIQVATIYNKGMTLKEVNQSGRSIGDDIRRNISASGSFTLSTNYLTNPAGGRLCVDNYSYLWNYADAIQSGNPNVVRYATGGSRSGETIRLVKVPDPSGAYCARSGSTFVYATVRASDQDRASELLQSGDRLLSIHQFALTTSSAVADPATGQRLFQLSYTIGTGEVAALTTDRSSCLPPGAANANFSYCAVQQFELVIRAGNGVN